MTSFGSVLRGSIGIKQQRRNGSVRARLGIEPLEWRCLLDGGIRQFPILPFSDSNPYGITQGPDGNIWFTEEYASKVARITPDGRMADLRIGPLGPPGVTVGPTGITAGPDGNIWFVEYNADKIGRLTPDFQLTEFPIPSEPGDDLSHSSFSSEITVGPDRNLWFAEGYRNRVGRISPTTGQFLTSIHLPTTPTPRWPSYITMGPDNAVWFTELWPGLTQLGRIDADFHLTEIPTSSTPNIITTGPNKGPDQTVWFTELTADMIGQITVHNDGHIDPPSYLSVAGGPGGICQGPDGTLWFTDSNSNEVGRMTADGTITRKISIPTVPSGPGRIVWSDPKFRRGGDGNIWFTEYVNQIGQVVLDKPLKATSQTISPTEGTPFTGTVTSFTDDDPNAAAGNFNAQIDWSDGTASAGTITANGRGGFDVVGTHTYTEEGNFRVTATISDIDETQDIAGNTATASSTANVADAPLSAQGIDLSSVEGQSTQTVLVATVGDAGEPEAPDDYTATIDWGDGSPVSNGNVTVSGSLLNVTGSHYYADERAYRVSVTIADDGGSTIATTGTAFVADAPLTALGARPLHAVEGQATGEIAVATFTDAAGPEPANGYRATIDWGDGTSITSGILDSSYTTFIVTGNHAYAEEGIYLVTVSIRDDGGATANTCSLAFVSDARLSSPFPLSFSGIAGVPVNPTVGLYVDEGGPEDVRNYRATIDWGDGTRPDESTVEHVVDSLFLVHGNHTYATTGTFTVAVNINDEGGSQLTVSTTGTIASPGVPPPGRGASGFPSVVTQPANDLGALTASPREEPREQARVKLVAAVFCDPEYRPSTRISAGAVISLAGPQRHVEPEPVEGLTITVGPPW
jgi:streptogramin lyase